MADIMQTAKKMMPISVGTGDALSNWNCKRVKSVWNKASGILINTCFLVLNVSNNKFLYVFFTPTVLLQKEMSG